MFHKSIRFKITIAYMIILALTLSVFSVILYQYMKNSLYENTDTLLRSKAEDIVHLINTYWVTERSNAMRYGLASEEADVAKGVDFAAFAQKWVEGKSKDPKLLDIIVQIFDADGVPVASSKNTQGISSISRENLISVLQGNSCFDKITSSFPMKKMLVFRAFITPAIENDKVEYIVQVASPLDSVNTALNTLKVSLFVLFPLTVLITGIRARFLQNSHSIQ